MAKAKKAKSRPATVVRNYCFRARTPDKAEFVLQQMLGKHRFSNAIRGIEIERRKSFDKRLRELCPEYDRLSVAVDNADLRVEAAYQAIRNARKQARCAVDPTPEQEREVELAKAQRKAAWEARQSAKTLALKLHKEDVAPIRAEYDRQIEAELKSYIKRAGSVESLPPTIAGAIKERHMRSLLGSPELAGEPDAYLAVKEARKNRQCYSGSGGAAEEALKDIRSGAPPKFKGWDNDEFVSVQIAGKQQKPIADVFAGKCSALKIDFPFLEQLMEKGFARGRTAKATVTLKLGKDSESIITFKAVLHRPLPMDGVICWVHLHRRKVGTKIEWELRFAIRMPAPVPVEAEHRRAVMVHLGFRNMGDSVRAATWVDPQTDGSSDCILSSTDRYAEKGYADLPESGELTFGVALLEQVKGIADIESERKKRFNATVKRLNTYLEYAKVPAWLTEATETLSLWKSQKRLAILVSEWSKQRFRDDEDIFGELVDWLAWDTVRWNKARRNDRKFRRHRKDCYRRFAKRLSEKYAFCVLPDVNWAELKRKPGVLDSFEPRAMRRLSSFVACGQLKEMLVEAFGSARMKMVESSGITMVCSSCRSVQEINSKSPYHRCTSCGEEYDVDVNAMRNQLNAMDSSGEAAA